LVRSPPAFLFPEPVEDAAKGKRKRSFRFANVRRAFRFRPFRLQTGSLAPDYARTPAFCQRHFRYAAVRADSANIWSSPIL
jgi:hypothetical protein